MVCKLQVAQPVAMVDSFASDTSDVSDRLETAPEHLQLVARWCALSRLGSRRLRAAAGTATQLNKLWHDEGAPQLSSQNHALLQQWLAGERHALFRWSKEFPVALKQIPDPPVALFACGKLRVLGWLEASRLS